MKNLLLLAITLAAAFATGCTTTPSSPPAYNVVALKGAAFEPGKPSGYDAANGCYWLYGNGSTVRLDPAPAPTAAPGNGNGNATTASTAASTAAAAPDGDLVLYLRTVGDARATSNPTMLRVATPEKYFTTGLQKEDIVQATSESNSANVEIFRDTGYICATRDGVRVRVVLSAKFLRRFAPAGAAFTWFDTSQSALPLAGNFPKEKK